MLSIENQSLTVVTGLLTPCIAAVIICVVHGLYIYENTVLNTISFADMYTLISKALKGNTSQNVIIYNLTIKKKHPNAQIHKNFARVSLDEQRHLYHLVAEAIYVCLPGHTVHKSRPVTHTRTHTVHVLDQTYIISTDSYSNYN